MTKPKPLVLAALDLHVVRLQGGRHHRAPAAASAAAAYAACGSAAGADGVEGVLAPLGGPLASVRLGAWVLLWWEEAGDGGTSPSLLTLGDEDKKRADR